MSKKLGLENKYKQFINPTKLGEYKAIMGKGTSFTPTKGTFKERRYTLSGSPAKFFAKASSSVLKKSPIGKVISAVGKAFMSKPGMFGAGVGIGANAKPEVFKNNKKMGGGMMRYKTGSKDVVKGKMMKAIHPTDHPDVKMVKKIYAKNKIYAGSDEEVAKDLDKLQNKIARKRTKTEGSFSKGNAVKLSPKQKKIAAMAGNPKKIEAVDFDKLRTMKARKGIAVTLKQVYAHAKKNKGEDRVTPKDIKMAKKTLGYKNALPEIKATGARMGKMMKKKNV